MSREKQIDIDIAVEEMASAIREITVKCGKCEYYKDGSCLKPIDMGCDINEDILNECDTLYTAGYRKQEWISVDERLPERNGRYLTHCNIEGQSLVCILYYCKVGVFNEGTVTHWMPLPEAPKMKNTEN